MALIVVNSTAGGTGTPYNLGAVDSLFVGPSAVIYSTDSAAIVGTGNLQRVEVTGSVLSLTNDAINLGVDANSSGIRVVIGANGYLSAGDDGVSIRGGGNSVYNHGTIQGGYGVYIGGGVTGTTNVVTNTGTITAYNSAVVSMGGPGAIRLLNDGIIRAEFNSFLGGAGDDYVLNNGTMYGDIILQGGNDTYDGTFGRIDGTISGGEGDDTFMVGIGSETIDGGNGTDTLDFRKSAGINVSLDESFANTGVATEDSYTNIENVIGSGRGNDRLGGDNAANSLFGLGGDDTLEGGRGADRLFGGMGVDVLSGGLGNDRFYFANTRDAGDIITDFANDTGNNDAIYLSSSGFGNLATGRILGTWFRARADNVAQDGDDHFIFRTTDKTLWYDADGNLSQEAVLIADLQDSAPNLTINDIFIY